MLPAMKLAKLLDESQTEVRKGLLERRQDGMQTQGADHDVPCAVAEVACTIMQHKVSARCSTRCSCPNLTETIGCDVSDGKHPLFV